MNIKIITQLTLVILMFSNCAINPIKSAFPSEKLNRTFQTSKKETHLVGRTTLEALKKPPYEEWFTKNYDEYQIQQEKLNGIKSKFKDISITIFMATWCGDSKREVPRFLKIMKHLQFPDNQLTTINLYLDDPNYKQSIDHEEVGLNIHRVPTFIFYKKGAEIGRIVEGPTNSLETDIAQILLGVPSRPKYRAVTTFDKMIKEKGVTYLVENKASLAQRTKYTVQGSYELNTYGYVLLSTDQKDAAIAIFEINALAFPKNANVFDSLAEGYIAIGKPKLAIENYKKVVLLDDKNERAIEKLKELQQEENLGKIE